MTFNWDGNVPLTQILEHVRPAYGGQTWDEASAYLHSTPSEAAIIRELAASGPDGFREPVRIDFDEPDDPEDGFDPTPPDPFGREWFVSNGMHRIATAVMLNHTHILCSQYRSPSPESDALTEYIEVEFQIPGDWPEDDPEKDAISHACDWLRSFPLPDDTWVETAFLSGGIGDRLEGLWYCPHEQVETLLTEMRQRVPAIVIDTYRCVTGAELDAKYATEG